MQVRGIITEMTVSAVGAVSWYPVDICVITAFFDWHTFLLMILYTWDVRVRTHKPLYGNAPTAEYTYDDSDITTAQHD